MWSSVAGTAIAARRREPGRPAPRPRAARRRDAQLDVASALRSARRRGTRSDAAGDDDAVIGEAHGDRQAGVDPAVRLADVGKRLVVAGLTRLEAGDDRHGGAAAPGQVSRDRAQQCDPLAAAVEELEQLHRRDHQAEAARRGRASGRRR